MQFKTKAGSLLEKVLFSYVILFGMVAISFFNLGRQWGTITGDDNKQKQTNSHSHVALLARAISFVGGYHHHRGKLQTIAECGCNRSFFYTPPGKHTKRLNSSCSDEGSFYEPAQKVVSFTLHITKEGPDEDSRKIRIMEYMEGITENLKRMKAYYPGSSLRLYTDLNLEQGSDYCRLLCANPELHWCDIRNTPSLGDQSGMIFRTWRFLPLGDPTVDYFLSRDLDSVIIERQVAAVNEWLQSDKAFHAMRDKEVVHNVLIMAGLWGGRNSVLGLKEMGLLRSKIMELAKIPSKVKFRDQIILKQVIFDLRKGDILSFDSYFCKAMSQYMEVRPFPIQRKNTYSDFAGNVGLGRKEYNLSKCPVECRPEYGKGWEYC